MHGKQSADTGKTWEQLAGMPFTVYQCQCSIQAQISKHVEIRREAGKGRVKLTIGAETVAP
jgi:hypothetical protein